MLDSRGAPAPVKIATWNVNGIRARQDEVATFVTRERPDVLCLQEIKAARDHIPGGVGELALTDYWGYWHGSKGYSGVALLTTTPLTTTPAPNDGTVLLLKCVKRPVTVTSSVSF